MSDERSTNWLSHMLTLPTTDPKRVRFENEIWLLGSYGECRYYLSVVTGVDQFDVTESPFRDNLQRFVVSRTGEGAHFFFQEREAYQVEFFYSVLRAAFEESRGIPPERKGSKQRRAIVTLLQHPDWSDAEIADAVGTTVEQLQRNTDFTALRSVPRRAAEVQHRRSQERTG